MESILQKLIMDNRKEEPTQENFLPWINFKGKFKFQSFIDVNTIKILDDSGREWEQPRRAE